VGDFSHLSFSARTPWAAYKYADETLIKEKCISIFSVSFMIRERIKEKTHFPIPVFLFIPDLEVRKFLHVGREQTMQSPLRVSIPHKLEVQVLSNSFPICTQRARTMS
jgi:hypothetical protein